MLLQRALPGAGQGASREGVLWGVLGGAGNGCLQIEETHRFKLTIRFIYGSFSFPF